MTRIRRQIGVVVGAAVLILALGGCAASAPGTASDPSAKQRANSERQEALQEMEKKGQRN